MRAQSNAWVALRKELCGERVVLGLDTSPREVTRFRAVSGSSLNFFIEYPSAWMSVTFRSVRASVDIAARRASPSSMSSEDMAPRRAADDRVRSVRRRRTVNYQM